MYVGVKFIARERRSFFPVVETFAPQSFLRVYCVKEEVNIYLQGSKLNPEVLIHVEKNFFSNSPIGTIPFHMYVR
jgi:hypothetical protein